MIYLVNLILIVSLSKFIQLKSQQPIYVNEKRNKMVIIFSPPHKNEKEELAEFYLNLYLDVLLEVLRFGDRYRLAKLERTGLRLHQIVENYFSEKPFLSLKLSIRPWL